MMTSEESFRKWVWLNPRKGVVGELTTGAWLLTHMILVFMAGIVVICISYGLFGTEYGVRGAEAVRLIATYLALIGGFVLVTRWLNSEGMSVPPSSEDLNTEVGER